MRIVGGRHRGRPLSAPTGRDVRPTSDRVREALFNILAHGDAALPEGAAVLDVFAGTGALGLEALSRGARHAAFIDNNRASLACLTGNIDRLGERQNTTIIRRDATRPGTAPRPYQLAFLDPPYGKGLAEPVLQALAANGWLTDDATVILELARTDRFEAPEGFTVTDQRIYGATRIVRLDRT
ncbi:MAG: 16S rRNA (guanine(966)-N(2))-methyltransferase RsmD [Sphingomonadales bacterium]